MVGRESGLFYEEFVFDHDDDDPAAEYDSDKLKIFYYLSHINDGISDFVTLISHEWLHGLIDWALEGIREEGDDHFIMREISFGE